MNNRKISPPLLFILLFVLVGTKMKACSMYKITVDGKTMVGCNEDAWRAASQIWFQNAKSSQQYGAGFTGSRRVTSNQFAPQSGMNEVGLTFSRLASYFPKQNSPSSSKIKITNEVNYLTDILHQCATVDEVKTYIEQYDHSIFIDDVFIYIDRSGKYLIVEPYKLIEGEDPYYVLSNFCPSITDKEYARKLERYRNGEDFLSNHNISATLSICKAISDTMHVCRKRNGDGTLLTSIWDTQNGLVNLYFYHDYDSTIQFNLAEELAKGDHMLNVVSLFPVNAEFTRLVEYKTPFNTPSLRVLLAIVGAILPFIALLFFIIFIRNRKAANSYKIFMAASMLNLLLSGYFFVLATNIGIYYFDVPYQDHSSNIISLSSYIPFLLLVAMLPILVLTMHFVKKEQGKVWTKSLLIMTNLVYLISIFGFGYWGLFNYFS